MKEFSRRSDSKLGNLSLSLAIILFMVFIFAVYYMCCRKNDGLEVDLSHESKDDFTVLSRFRQFMVKYNKTYQHKEYDMRLRNFKKFLKRVEKLNRPYIKARKAPVHGVTKFADMSQSEFIRKYLGGLEVDATSSCANDKRDSFKRISLYEDSAGDTLNRSVDWRQYGYVGGVVDQRTCAGCWAISIVGVMETMAAKQQQYLQRFSIQQLIDCDVTNGHCNRGNVLGALRYMCLSKMEMAKEEEYPETWVNENCRRNVKTHDGWKLYGYSFLCNPDVNNTLRLLAKHGPLVVQVNARNWNSYVGGGVIQWHCSDDPSLLNHAVQLVGYNLNDDVPYYIVRNSWGEDFGEDGYLRLKIAGNLCGVRNFVSSLDVTK